MYDIKMSRRAVKDMSKLERNISKRINSKLKEYRSAANPMKFAQPLGGDLKGLYRFRIGEYRAIFEKNQDGKIIILMILRIKHRKDIYQ